VEGVEKVSTVANARRGALQLPGKLAPPLFVVRVRAATGFHAD
jgi:hypothetical protein